MPQIELSKQEKSVQLLKTFGQTAFSALLCLSLMVWSLAPNANHVPSLFEVVAEHREMVAEHGHSHGFQEDLQWALHGHSHDVLDHDHSQAVLTLGTGSSAIWGYRDVWKLHMLSEGPYRTYMIERPPRA